MSEASNVSTEREQIERDLADQDRLDAQASNVSRDSVEPRPATRPNWCEDIRQARVWIRDVLEDEMEDEHTPTVNGARLMSALSSISALEMELERLQVAFEAERHRAVAAESRVIRLSRGATKGREFS